MKLEPGLRTEFMEAAEASHGPASQVMRELMRAFVQDQRAHSAFLHRKVEAARASISIGKGRSDEAIATDLVARSARIADPP